MKKIGNSFDEKGKIGAARRSRLGTPVIILFIATMLVSCSKKNSAMSANISPVATNSVNISGMAFSPSSITTTVGTTVTWTNNDNMDHTVTADDNSFDSGSIAVGGTYSRTFSSAGNFGYHCSIHPGMRGSVAVK